MNFVEYAAHHRGSGRGYSWDVAKAHMGAVTDRKDSDKLAWDLEVSIAGLENPVDKALVMLCDPGVRVKRKRTMCIAQIRWKLRTEWNRRNRRKEEVKPNELLPGRAGDLQGIMFRALELAGHHLAITPQQYVEQACTAASQLKGLLLNCQRDGFGRTVTATYRFPDGSQARISEGGIS